MKVINTTIANKIIPFIQGSLVAFLTCPFSWLAMGVTLTAFAAYLRTLAPTITWRHGGADSGELAAAVATLGIAHPPGYPTYVLLGYAWTWLPLGDDLAYRLNLLSATGASLAAGLLVLTVVYLGRQQRLATLPLAIGAVAGGVFLAFSPITWSQAIITEVYAPGLAVLGLLSWLLLKWAYQPRRRLLLLAGIVGGLGFGILPQIILVVPGALFLLYRQKGSLSPPGVQLWRRFSPLLLGTVIGLSIFAYLPLRALTHPLVNWGDPATLPRFWAVVTAAQYHQYVVFLTPNEWFERLLDSLFQLKQALGWAGLGLAGLGGYTLGRGNRGALYYWLTLAGLTILFRSSYPVIGNIVYLLPVLYSLALLAGIGVVSLLTMTHSHLGHSGVALLGFSFLISIVVGAVIVAPQLDLSHDDQAGHFGQEVFATLPPQAIVVSNQDEITFSLWYQQALGARADVVVVDNRLLAYDWYQRHLEHRHPNLNLAGDTLSSQRPIYMLTGTPGEARLSLTNNLLSE